MEIFGNRSFKQHTEEVCQNQQTWPRRTKLNDIVMLCMFFLKIFFLTFCFFNHCSKSSNTKKNLLFSCIQELLCCVPHVTTQQRQIYIYILVNLYDHKSLTCRFQNSRGTVFRQQSSNHLTLKFRQWCSPVCKSWFMYTRLAGSRHINYKVRGGINEIIRLSIY